MVTDKQIREIVDEIELDIKDRRGLESEWNQIDEDIVEEIKETWFNIIKDKLGEINGNKSFKRD